jgi:tetratricopeptide (TPR) repeat protein
VSRVCWRGTSPVGSVVRAAVLLGVLVAATGACRRSPKVDPHLRAGFELITTDPARALQELDLVPGDHDPEKAYGKGLANEALGRYDAAAQCFEEAVAQRKDLFPARTALARVRIFRGEFARGQDELAAIVTEAPGELPAVLLYAVIAGNPEAERRALDALRAWPGHRAPVETQKPTPAEYWLLLGVLEQRAGQAMAAKAALEHARADALSSPRGAIALAQIAARLARADVAAALVQRLAAAKLSPGDARDVATLALDLSLLGAAERATKQLPLFPEDPTNLLFVGRYQLAARDRARGIATLRRGLRLAAGRPGAPRDELDYELARALLDDGDAAGAEELAAALATRRPDLVSAQVLLARIEVLAKHADRAVVRLDRALKAHPNNPLILENRAAAHVAAGAPAAAERDLRQLVQVAPLSARATELYVALLEKRGRHDAAASALEAALARMPRSTSLLKALADHHLRRGAPGRALEVLRRGAAQAPDDVDVAFLLAATYERLGRRDDLRRTVTELTQRVPGDVRTWLALARLEQISKHPSATEAALQKAIAVDPRAPEPHARLAQHYSAQHEPQRAAEQYQKVIEISAEDALALNNAAVLYTDELGDPDRAVPLAERALARAPQEAIVEDTLGWALVRRGKVGDRERALDLLRHANQTLQLDATRIHLAVALQQLGAESEARELVKGARFDELDPGQRWAREQLGVRP